MQDDDSLSGQGSSVERRSFLGLAGTSAFLSFFGPPTRTSSSQPDTAEPTDDGRTVDAADYENVIDVVEAGADPDGQEPVTPVLRDIADDDTLLEFPDGRYLMDEQLRFTGFEQFGMVGEGDATIVPAPADEYHGEARLFKLGTYYNPGHGLAVENFRFDFTAENTGLRALQTQVADDLAIRDITVAGRHDAGTWGPLAVDIVEADGTGVVEDVDLSDGGAYTEDTPGDADPTVDTGPTGALLSTYHEGTLTFRNLRMGAFPDNGLYVSGEGGQVIVDGGRFANSNVAGVRLAGDGSNIRDATFVVDHTRSADETQRAIRVDGGSDMAVRDVEIDLESATGEAIAVTAAADSVRIEGTSITVDDRPAHAIAARAGSGHVEIVDVDVQTNEGGHALFLDRSDSSAVVENLRVTGDASGAYGARCAVRCERDGTAFQSLQIDQPGDGYRRAVGIHADDVSIQGGEYRATHHPIINSGGGIEIHEITARSGDAYEAIKLLADGGHVDVSHSTLYEGILDQGTADLDDWDNEYPDA